jgi:hypothetical protein
MKSVFSDSFHWALPFGSLDFEVSMTVKNVIVRCVARLRAEGELCRHLL